MSGDRPPIAPTPKAARSLPESPMIDGTPLSSNLISNLVMREAASVVGVMVVFLAAPGSERGISAAPDAVGKRSTMFRPRRVTRGRSFL